ncbi:hypothetical protein [Sulfitobacter dubius]|uniref:hypothetical protein n=1 Tax=Sulfitobacter dubius TaxID=218673 RepID=UPI002943C29E|nr:hypothetical protein [Sulfitobacter dubius]WOI29129.1 hypothetical protein R1T39_15830 [Sulfitobacter dubius]
MVTLSQIENAVRAHRGSWHTLFRREGERTWQCILFPRHRLTEQDYRTLERRLNAPQHAQELTVAEKTRNKLRGIADAAGEGGRRYG